MTAVALLLAIFKSKPSPFCILDEVDAALDDGNVGRYLGVIQEFRQWTQFIIVSHRKHTMAGADVLYGVTMEEAGVSKRMSVRFEDVSEDGHFRSSPQAAPAPAHASHPDGEMPSAA
jgi:chromosome segregation protein